MKPFLFSRLLNRIVVAILLSSNLAMVVNPAYGSVNQQTKRNSEQNTERITFIREGNIWVTVPDGSSEKQLTTQGNYSSPIWSSTGSQIAYIKKITADNGHDAWQIGIFDIDSSTEQIIVPPEHTPFVLPGNFNFYENVRWSSDGTSLLYLSEDGRVQGRRVYEVNLASGKRVTTFRDFFSIGFDVSRVDGSIVSEDYRNSPPLGNGFYYLSSTGVQQGTILPVGGGGMYSYPHWSPDGKKIAYVNFDANSKKYSIKAIDPGGNNSETLIPEDNLELQDFSWSPDGKKLVFESNGTLKLFDLTTGDIINSTGGGQPDWGIVPDFFTSGPPTVSNVEARPGPKAKQVVLSWANPNPPLPGFSTATSYEFRYSKDPITDENWDEVERLGAPEKISAEEWLVPRDFDLNTRWYFAGRTIDKTGNLSEISNLAWIIDTGFRPDKDGFSFCNEPLGTSSECDQGWSKYPTPPADNDFTVEDLRHMFGDTTVCQSVDKNNKCVLFPVADIWRKNANQSLSLGHCYGMSLAAQILYPGEHYDGKDYEELYNLHLLADRTSGLILPYARRPISYLQIYQFTDPVRNYMNEIEHKKVEDIMKQLVDSLDTKPLDPLVLFMEKGEQGHALSPFAVSNQSPDTTRVWVYDSNWPSENDRYVQVTGNEWVYTVTFDDQPKWGTSNGYNLGVISITMNSGNPKPIWDIFEQDEIWLAGSDAHLLIKNNQNQQIGFEGHSYINTIPGATYHTIISGQDPIAEPIYRIPDKDDYSIMLWGNGTSTSTTITQFGANYAASIEDIPVNSDTRDTLQISSNKTLITYQASEEKSFSLVLALDGKESSYKFRVLGVDIGKGETILLQAKLDHGQLIFSNAHASGGSYDLQISRFDSTGEQKATYPNIPIEANTSQIIQLNSWDPLKPISISIDLNNDGHSDLEKEWTAQGEHPQSKLPPITWILFTSAGICVLIVFSILVILILLRYARSK